MLYGAPQFYVREKVAKLIVKQLYSIDDGIKKNIFGDFV